MATENDSVNTGALGTLVAVGAAAMIGICLAVNALVRHEIGTVGAVRDEVGADAYRTLRTEQLDKLGAPAAWSNREKGHVSIPIERAMNIVLTDLKRSPWNATPSPVSDAGTDAAAEAPDAGADAATPQADAGTAPEPLAPAPLSPSVPTPSVSSKPAPEGSPAPPAPGTPAPKPPAPPTAGTPPATPAPPSASPPATPQPK